MLKSKQEVTKVVSIVKKKKKVESLPGIAVLLMTFFLFTKRCCSFSFFLQRKCYGYSLELPSTPLCGTSAEYP